MAKTRNDEAYEQGVNDGKNGNIFSDFAHSVGKSLNTNQKDEIYDKGYKNGAENRHNSSSSSSSSSGSSDGGGCYITTACMNSAGIPDDHIYLSTLRKFRDNELISTLEGRLAVKEYYNVAPDIVRSIEKKENSKEIWDSVYEDIKKAVLLVRKGNFKDAFEHYKNMTLELKSKYLD